MYLTLRDIYDIATIKTKYMDMWGGNHLIVDANFSAVRC